MRGSCILCTMFGCRKDEILEKVFEIQREIVNRRREYRRFYPSSVVGRACTKQARNSLQHPRLLRHICEVSQVHNNGETCKGVHKSEYKCASCARIVLPRLSTLPLDGERTTPRSIRRRRRRWSRKRAVLIGDSCLPEDVPDLERGQTAAVAQLELAAGSPITDPREIR